MVLSAGEVADGSRADLLGNTLVLVAQDPAAAGIFLKDGKPYAMGDRLVAEGRVIRPGRRIVAVASDVFAEGDKGRKHVATLLGTMVPVES